MENSNYHIPVNADLSKFAHDAALDLSPRHTLWTIGQELGAKFYRPSEFSPSFIDKVLSKIACHPQKWALAKYLSGHLTAKDTIFVNGEDIGYPIAVMLRNQNDRPKLCVFVHNMDSLRFKALLKIFNLDKVIDLFMTNTVYKADYIVNFLNIPPERIVLIDEQTDTKFFTPGPSDIQKNRPIIGSGGLEQRDYRTLAEATKNLDVDVRICAVSPDAKATREKFPEEKPQNMEWKYYDWQALRQLYRNSDIVVVPLQDHKYQAGMTTLFESLSCCRPVIMTNTPGIVEKFAKEGVLIGVEPGNPIELRNAINYLIENPKEAEQMAKRGHQLVLEQYNSEQYVSTIINNLIDLNN
jgi:glycosyltransferase involved in cell wall biosynthesis